MRHGQRQLDLVGHGVGIGSATDRKANGGRTSPQGSPSEPERAHCAMDCGEEDAGLDRSNVEVVREDA